MKLVLFKYGKGTKKNKPYAQKNYEGILFVIFVIVFSTLIIAQTALINPYVRAFLTTGSELEGSPLANEEYLFNEGKLSLGLVGKLKDEDLKVLVNGEEVCVFSYSIAQVEVKDGDVVEIEAGASGGGAEVEVLSKTDNISTQCVGKRFKVEQGKKRIVKVNVNKN